LCRAISSGLDAEQPEDHFLFGAAFKRYRKKRQFNRNLSGYFFFLPWLFLLLL